jgi:hypothetical protein
MERAVFPGAEDDVPVQAAVALRAVAALTGQDAQGIVGSGITPGPECEFDRPVRVPGGPMPFTVLLDSIVRQVPGLAWIVLYDADAPARGLKVGLLCRTGADRLTSVDP